MLPHHKQYFKDANFSFDSILEMKFVPKTHFPKQMKSKSKWKVSLESITHMIPKQKNGCNPPFPFDFHNQKVKLNLAQ